MTALNQNGRAHFENAIQRLKDEKRYRVFVDIERDAARYPIALWRPDGAEDMREVTIWCSNDYLGMGGHPKVREAAIAAVERHGAGAGGTRNISGTHHRIVELEAELADLHGKEASLVFTSGWISNLAGISTIASLMPDCLILSDALNHNSIIEGVRRASCEKKVWRHNDVADLERLLIEAGHERAKLIVFESLYSMDGDIAPVREIVELAERHNALTYIDEVHAVGMYGPARRRHRRTRGPHGPHRRDRGHARERIWIARRIHRGRRLDRRCGAKLCPAVHLHHHPPPDGHRGGLRCDPPPERFGRRARGPSIYGRRDQTCASRRGPAGPRQSVAYRAPDGRRRRAVQGRKRPPLAAARHLYPADQLSDGRDRNGAAPHHADAPVTPRPMSRTSSRRWSTSGRRSTCPSSRPKSCSCAEGRPASRNAPIPRCARRRSSGSLALTA